MPRQLDPVLHEIQSLLFLDEEDCQKPNCDHTECLHHDSDRHYGRVELRRATWTGHRCELLLAVKPAKNDDYEQIQDPSDECTEAFKIRIDRADYIKDSSSFDEDRWHRHPNDDLPINLHDDHPLLWGGPTVQLMFHGRVRKALAAATDMFDAYEAYYFGWKQPTVREVRDLAKTLADTGGYVVAAPPRLADIYADILAAYGTEPYFFPARKRGTPKEGYEPDQSAGRVLFLNSEYLVGSGFRVDRVPMSSLTGRELRRAGT